jgi:gamma-glutamyl hercynylcysteine S-oxide synthase
MGKHDLMTTIASPSRSDHQAIARALGEARERTFQLLAPLSSDDLRAQHDPLMSPLLWDLGHIAHFEELWLTRNLDGPIEFVEMPGLFNPFEHPRSSRGALPLPDLDRCRAIMEEIRERVLERLARADFDSENPLLRDGYVYRMVLRHEYQHNETMLQTLQLKQGRSYAPIRRDAARSASSAVESGRGDMARFSGGLVQIGTDDRSAAYDNERPQHTVRVEPFWIDVFPVTNGEFAEFVDAAAYQHREWWSEAGWRWLQESRVECPKYWARSGSGWITRSMDHSGPLIPSYPVSHVCYYEADAYARSKGKRLPTEIEWEAAASWDPVRQRTRVYPWGDEPASSTWANLDQLTFGTAPVGSYAQNVSPIGCYGMIGDLWEWTSSDFGAYPGFESFPYPEYSQAFFGNEYKVLRGGSWATRPGAIRNTFRNWDYPVRRQIFSGFRCAANA